MSARHHLFLVLAGVPAFARAQQPQRPVIDGGLPPGLYAGAERCWSPRDRGGRGPRTDSLSRRTLAHLLHRRFPALVLTASALDGSNVRTLTDASAPVFNPVESPDGRLMDALVLPRRSHRVPERSQRSDGGVGDERGRNGSEADNELATGFSPAASDRG